MLTRENISECAFVSAECRSGLGEYVENSFGMLRPRVPFITTKRISSLLPVLTKLTKRGVRIVINTRNPEDHDGIYRIQAEQAIVSLQNIGVLVLYTGGHHRKIAIIDKSIIWEGSLNILSHNDSCEIMRRTESKYAAQQLIKFVKIDKYL